MKKDQFAIIQTGGKQYRIAPGDSIMIEKLPGEYSIGDKLSFDQVLLKDNGKETQIGTPMLPKTKVEGKITEIGRDKKISVIHFRSKSNHFKKKGHRQPFMRVLIEKV